MSTSNEYSQSFENFIVKGSNRLAYLAFREFGTPDSTIAGVRGLFLSSTGPWGKTHLLEALSSSLSASGAMKILKISASRLMEVRAGDIEAEVNDRLPWRECDAVVVDDVHLLATRPEAQYLLIQIFDEAPAGRLIFSATTSPRDLSGLSEPLRSRLGGGLVLKIEPPEFELLMELAEAKAARLNLAASEESLTALVRQAGDDPRQLSGLLETAAFIMSKTGQSLDEAARRICPETAGPAPIAEQITIETVMAGVAVAFGLKVSDLTGHSKIRQAAWPRRVAMYLARELTTLTTTDIGDAFGGRDHSTVIHALKKINEELKKPSQAKLVDNIRRSIMMG
ncbi:hypothetical protein C4J81_09335 [Deltaproteobacteria bacterium Smac51]|nr:hypothetical protein C4J81_09335 [Deltaproteobacteria bacterium Smac51]